MAAQARREVPVQLHDRQLAQAFDQGLRHGAQARPDFDHRLAGPWIYGAHDRIDDALVGQEVLAESFAGDVLQVAAPLGARE